MRIYSLCIYVAQNFDKLIVGFVADIKRKRLAMKYLDKLMAIHQMFLPSNLCAILYVCICPYKDVDYQLLQENEFNHYKVYCKMEGSAIYTYVT